MSADDNKLGPFISLHEGLDPDPDHSAQVARLALTLFDQLKILHKLKNEDRFLLHAAALCHDIGLVRGAKAHHKTSRDLLLAGEFEQIARYDQIMIALIARYHRKALPENKHKYFRDLSRKDQLRVCKLAGMLRIADGLDRTHRGVVECLRVSDDGTQVSIGIVVRHDASLERLIVVENKQDLFEKVFSRKVQISEIDYQHS